MTHEDKNKIIEEVMVFLDDGVSREDILRRFSNEKDEIEGVFRSIDAFAKARSSVTPDRALLENILRDLPASAERNVYMFDWASFVRNPIAVALPVLLLMIVGGISFYFSRGPVIAPTSPLPSTSRDGVDSATIPPQEGMGGSAQSSEAASTKSLKMTPFSGEATPQTTFVHERDGYSFTYREEQVSSLTIQDPLRIEGGWVWSLKMNGAPGGHVADFFVYDGSIDAALLAEYHYGENEKVVSGTSSQIAGRTAKIFVTENIKNPAIVQKKYFIQYTPHSVLIVVGRVENEILLESILATLQFK